MVVLSVLVGILLVAVLVLLAVVLRSSRGTQDTDAVRRAAELSARDTAKAVERSAREAADATIREAREAADTVIRDAREAADSTLREARTAAESARAAAEADARAARDAAELARRTAESDATATRDEVRRLQEDLARRETRLAEREQRLDAAQAGVDATAAELRTQAADLATQREQLADLQAERTRVLEQTAALTREDARTELVKTVEHQAKREAALIVREIEAEARDLGETRARAIVADAVQRVASEQTAESVVTLLQLPSDDMKGRIIGREGRNIRAFEQVTGVNVLIDDTPEAVLLSCFDPVRREVGRVTLERLVLDGRIHPQRIEDAYALAVTDVESANRRAGEDALVEVGLTDVHDELVDLLGRLRLRTSYGQNVLKHLVETAHLAGMMAAELRMDPTLVKRGAFLHDIGKALTHEVEGSHAIIGADLARRLGEPEEVVHAIEAHHNEVAPETIEAVLTQASDSCSGGRPGARRESLESYVQRLQRIEEIASGRRGVDKVFAMQAGREVRVMVVPEEIDDVEALVLARDVAKQIEDELTYPGQIRVTVVRETRATEIAH